MVTLAVTLERGPITDGHTSEWGIRDGSLHEMRQKDQRGRRAQEIMNMDIQRGLQFVSSPELCRTLNISRSTFYRLLDAGLPTIGSGRLRRHSLDAVLHWYDTSSN